MTDTATVLEATTQTLANRYVAVWNEPDPDVRHRAIRALWADDGSHTLLSPPQEMRDAATRLGFRTPALEMRGHDELYRRVGLAYEEFVAPGQYRFRLAEAARIDDVVTLKWEMVATETDEPVAGGLDILVLAADGGIHADYQVIPG